MKILRMKATFGCLDGAELALKPGVNVVTMANGRGKSTWAAFFLAMFYGIDTAQRAAKGRLPEKLRYEPWSGKAMEGILELEKDGKHLVLQRTSEKGKPFGQLHVYEKETGLVLPEITAENCGRYFLGTERSVFQRTAFLRGEEPAVTEDAALSRRLESLAVGGESGEAPLEADERLKQWKNRIRYHRTGLLPEVEQQLHLLMQALARQEQAESTRSALEQSGELLDARRRETAEALQAAQEALADAPAPKPLLLWLWPAILMLLVCGVCIWGRSWWALLPGIAAPVMIPIAIKRKKSADEKRQKLKTREAQAEQAYAEACAAHEKTAALRQELDGLPGEDRGELMDRWAALEQRRQNLLEQEQALGLAREALEFARNRQQQRYAPRLTDLAGERLSDLTAGQYTGILLERDLTLQVMEGETGLARPLAALSTGTQNQVWLALRLAMTELLLPEDVPIWLDDALVTFDADRTAAAMTLLSAEDRQIIVMNCK